MPDSFHVVCPYGDAVNRIPRDRPSPTDILQTVIGGGVRPRRGVPSAV